jgi:hypothetical protein
MLAGEDAAGRLVRLAVERGARRARPDGGARAGDRGAPDLGRGQAGVQPPQAIGPLPAVARRLDPAADAPWPSVVRLELRQRLRPA